MLEVEAVAASSTGAWSGFVQVLPIATADQADAPNEFTARTRNHIGVARGSPTRRNEAAVTGDPGAAAKFTLSADSSTSKPSSSQELELQLSAMAPSEGSALSEGSQIGAAMRFKGTDGGPPPPVGSGTMPIIVYW